MVARPSHGLGSLRGGRTTLKKLARQIIRGNFYFSLRFRLLDARWKALGLGGMDPKSDCDACTYLFF
jgi:hypothetical protein